MQLPTPNIIAVVCVVTIFFLVVGAAFVLYVRLYNQRKRRYIEEREAMKIQFEKLLLQSQIEVQESTFSALGKDLHDNVGQLLSTTKMLLGITERSLSPVPDTLVTAHATLAKAILELRTLSKSLDKEWLEQFNCIESIKAEIHRINASNAIEIQFSHPAHLPMSADQQIILFRIIQEGIQNALKHGNASQIAIEISSGEHTTVLIKDNGKGMEVPTEGMGLKNMRKRTKLLNGTIAWNSIPGTGTIVCLQIQQTSNT